jgi:hypothetical protein
MTHATRSPRSERVAAATQGTDAKVDQRLDTVGAAPLLGALRSLTVAVEAAFDRVFSLEERRDGSFQMLAETPSGRRIWVIWRYDREDGELPDVFAELGEVPIFVITAYSEQTS